MRVINGINLYIFTLSSFLILINITNSQKLLVPKVIGASTN